MLGSSKFQCKKKKPLPMFPHYISFFICSRDGEGEHQSKTLQLSFSQRVNGTGPFLPVKCQSCSDFAVSSSALTLAA